MWNRVFAFSFDCLMTEKKNKTEFNTYELYEIFRVFMEKRNVTATRVPGRHIRKAVSFLHRTLNNRDAAQ